MRLTAILFLIACSAFGQSNEEITVRAKADDVSGLADSASEGIVTADWIHQHSAQRAGDILEAVPGVVISQHSGEGKANQYYLRGFDLDHGTDLAIRVAGVPLNMPTHAHGQGYADANFVIPELISRYAFRKGPYAAEDGDFAAAGAVAIDYVNSVDHPLLLLEGGQFGYRRTLLAQSIGPLLYAFEAMHNDGPWTRGDGYRRLNGLLRYSRADFTLTAMSYSGRWNSSDQIPERAIGNALSRFGEVDPSDGGSTQRHSLSLDWQRVDSSAVTRTNAYLIRYGLDLFSNFTYFLEHPDTGDQFEQEDRRTVTGFDASREWINSRGSTTAGLSLRNDDIGRVALYHTEKRQRLETIRSNRLDETSAGAYLANSTRWTSWLRTTAGVRADALHFGAATHSLLSPKVSVIAGPWRGSELYANYGFGFHSNDVRSSRDDGVTPLVRARGMELGWRASGPRAQTTVSLWSLNFGSELLYAGDSGDTEPSAATRRRGIEWSATYRPAHWIALDGEIAASRSRFRTGERISGAPERIAAATLTVAPGGPVLFSLRVREFGSRALTAGNDVRSRASRTISARASWNLSDSARVDVEGFNLLNARASDIDYFYVSRLPGEASQGVSDVHFHPVEPRSVRVGVTRRF